MENVERVRTSILESRRHSARKHALTVHKLSERDFNSRRNACKMILEDVPADTIVFFSGFHFHLKGYVSKQNMRYGIETNPAQFHQRPLHSPKVTV
ncbi:hypothetical protein Trydic_g23380 [Trypoxylus dichotomus]